MTGGQYSPTTPTGEKGTTAPYGNIDGDFDIPKLAEAAGATLHSQRRLLSCSTDDQIDRKRYQEQRLFNHRRRQHLSDLLWP